MQPLAGRVKDSGCGPFPYPASDTCTAGGRAADDVCFSLHALMSGSEFMAHGGLGLMYVSSYASATRRADLPLTQGRTWILAGDPRGHRSV